MRIRPGVEIAGLTDVGRVRENNEDSYIHWEPAEDALFERLGRLLVVADGMGGYHGGEIASQMAVKIVADIYLQSSQPDPRRRLSEAFGEAHRRIKERAAENPELREMGTTCTAIAVVHNQLYVAHIGDSRLYFFSAPKLQLLTRDHTLIARWVENGVIPPEEAATHPQRHVLTAALGVGEEIEPDLSPHPVLLKSGNVLLLCTDGLWGQVREEEIQEALAMRPPADSCRFLCNLAKERGGPDNITLQILRVL
jgi:PPM family protein phosphatase